jgi:hypothetical protein
MNFAFYPQEKAEGGSVITILGAVMPAAQLFLLHIV